MNWDWLKEIVQKAITIGISADAAFIAGGGDPFTKAAVAIFAYAVWTQVIVPRVNELLNGQKTAVGTPTKTNWELI